MVEKKWNELIINCPIDIESIVEYGRDFESNIPSKVTIQNIDECKKGVLDARKSFDSIIAALVQNLYNKDILIESEDKILFAWLVDNLGRYLKRLDDEEFQLVIKLDSPENSDVGISRVSSYIKILETSIDSIIYESIKKANKEFSQFKETKKLKKTSRAYLYILFHVLQVTLSILGGITREKTGGMTKRGIGGYKEDTGIDISKFDKEMAEFLEGDLEDETEENN